MSYYRNIRIFYAIIFFQNLIPAYVIERLFWRDRGMDVQAVVLCEIIYAAAIVLFEVPSGALADRIGRKKLIVMSSVMPCLEFLVLIFAHSFWQFALVSFLAGIGTSFASGAVNSVIYTSLEHDGRTCLFEGVLGRMGAFDFTAGTIAALSGGVIAASFGYTLNYQASVVSCVLAFILTLFIKEPPGQESGRPASLIFIAGAAFRFFRMRPNVLRVCLNAAVISALIVYVDEFWQIYLFETGVPVLFFGAAASLFGLSRIPAGMISALLIRRMSHETVLILAAFGCGVSVLTAAFMPGLAGAVCLCLAVGCAALTEPAVMGYLHRRAEDAERATIESVSSLLERGIGALFGLVFGFCAARLGIMAGFSLIGLGLITASAVFFFVGKRRINRKIY